MTPIWASILMILCVLSWPALLIHANIIKYPADDKYLGYHLVATILFNLGCAFAVIVRGFI